MSTLRQQVANLSADQQQLLRRRLHDLARRSGILDATSIRSRPENVSSPLSFAQRRLWLLQQLNPGLPVYHIPKAFRIRGHLDEEALRRALEEIVSRHQILRTQYRLVDGEPVQVRSPDWHLDLGVADLRHRPEDERERAARRLLTEIIERPFELSDGRPFRVALVRLRDEERLLLLVAHHIGVDDWSFRIIFQELGTLYEAFSSKRDSPLSEVPLQYSDFSIWQQVRSRRELPPEQVSCWERQFKERLPGLEFLPDRPRAAVPRFRGARLRIELSKTLTEALKAVSQTEGATLFMTLVAAFAIVLHRFTREEAIVFGTILGERSHVETEGLVGCFVNMSPLSVSVSSSMTFTALLRQVRSVTLEAWARKEIPFERVLTAAAPTRPFGTMPVLPILFNYLPVPTPDLRLAHLEVSREEVHNGSSPADLMISIREEPAGLAALLEYDCDLFDAATVRRIGDSFTRVLRAIGAKPSIAVSRIPIVAEDDRRKLLGDWNGTDTCDAPLPTLVEMFAAQAQRTPAAPAFLDRDRVLTYQELDRRSNQIAHHLRALGVGHGTLVGLCMERSCETTIALLGIFKAGGSYLPLDPAYPRARIDLMLDDSRTGIIVTEQRFAPLRRHAAAKLVFIDSEADTISQQTTHALPTVVAPNDLAYVIYTSGSTGTPKGVCAPHGQIVNRLIWMWKRYPFEPGEVCCHKTSLNFVDSLWELFGGLLQGVPTAIIRDDTLKDPFQFIAALARYNVTRLWMVPSLLRALLCGFSDLQRRVPKLTFWVSTGESLSKDLFRQFQDRMPGSSLFNLYGTSEVWDATWYEPDPHHDDLPRVPIGRPIANLKTYVLDAEQQLVPIGAPGELYVGGAGLALGYYNRPRLTAERFVPDPFSPRSGNRLYRTGDQVRYLPDGQLDFLGRLDDQIKLRGYRVEPGDVEHALARHPAVREVAVVAQPAHDEAGEHRLAAFLTLKAPGRHPLARELSAFLGERLPPYMLPAAYYILNELPLTPSGKLDRRGLVSFNGSELGRQDTALAPRTRCERKLLDIWSELLGVQNIGVHDNFFDLGGHSVMAIQVVARILDAFDVELPVRSLFEAPSVARLATIVERMRRSQEHIVPSRIPPRPAGEPVPVSFAQEHLLSIARLLPGAPFFNIPRALRLTGPLDVPALEQSFNEIVRRHEALRTTFATVDDRPVQIIAPMSLVKVDQIDLRTHGARSEAEALRLARAEARKPIDLSKGPLLRAMLLRLGDEDHVLVLVVHHIVSDFWSMSLLAHALGAAYNAFSDGRPLLLPDLPVQFGDYVFWERSRLQSGVEQADLAYWKKQLRGPLPVLQFAGGKPRGSVLSLSSSSESVVLPEALTVALRQACSSDRSTLFMTLLASFKALLASCTGQDDIRVATLVANRPRVELESLIGFFNNTIVLRSNLGGDPQLQEVAKRVRESALAAYEHQALPFEHLLSALERDEHVDRSTLVQAMFVLQHDPIPDVQWKGLSVSSLSSTRDLPDPNLRATTFDLVLFLREDQDVLSGSLLYKPDLFDASQIKRMIERFRELVTGSVVQPDRRLSAFREAWRL